MNDQVKGKSKATGYFGIWDTRNKKFLFGIQERTRKSVHYAVGNKIGWKQYYRKHNWIVKPIRECHASMFLKV